MLPAQSELYFKAHGRHLQFNQFNLKDKKNIQPFIDNFNPYTVNIIFQIYLHGSMYPNYPGFYIKSGF